MDITLFNLLMNHIKEKRLDVFGHSGRDYEIYHKPEILWVVHQPNPSESQLRFYVCVSLGMWMSGPNIGKLIIRTLDIERNGDVSVYGLHYLMAERALDPNITEYGDFLNIQYTPEQLTRAA